MGGLQRFSYAVIASQLICNLFMTICSRCRDRPIRPITVTDEPLSRGYMKPDLRGSKVKETEAELGVKLMKRGRVFFHTTRAAVVVPVKPFFRTSWSR